MLFSLGRSLKSYTTAADAAPQLQHLTLICCLVDVSVVFGASVTAGATVYLDSYQLVLVKDVLALEYYHKALAVREIDLGRDRVITSRRYRLMGIYHCATEKYELDVEYYYKALCIRKPWIVKGPSTWTWRLRTST